MTPDQFIRANAVLMSPPLTPELRLHLATEIVPLWRRTEEELEAMGVPPPYWAFAWAGGQALARYVLDNPELVAGKRVLDFGAGSGVVALAAAKAGAASVLAADIDKFSVAAIQANALANGLTVATTSDDLIGGSEDFDIILVGDMCYERPLAERLMAWLKSSAAEILLGDPGRAYFPKEGLVRLAQYNVATTRELEDREIRETGVWKLIRG
ncbi:MAG TPA: methyltransferase [Rhizomicrobium sp.]|jgi:predicted nicotinamide N-methyase|nr:methyltransferase [Rhizomicrobium sp.]